MEKAGVPTIPGMKSVPPIRRRFRAAARALGYPVMVKASAGGGGKGMRIVRGRGRLGPALEAGRREAKSAFGDDSVYLEKYIEEPRHVEFQVLADNHGQTVHLFERECSIQRRHQKILEESPSPALDPGSGREMGETAVRAMRAAGYNNAGTVEFLLDKDRRFYFLEVNARLQVEHPVTELVDRGRSRPPADPDRLRSRPVAPPGGPPPAGTRHRMPDLRRGSEDQLPSFRRAASSSSASRRAPASGSTAASTRASRSRFYYDPILAKLIVWAEDREAACRRMAAALATASSSASARRSVSSRTSSLTPSSGPAGRRPLSSASTSRHGGRGKAEDKRGWLWPRPLSTSLGGRGQRAGSRTKEDASAPWTTLGRWRAGE